MTGDESYDTLSTMEHLAVNAMGRARVEVIDGRKHIIAPLSLIVPGTLAGSKGALKYPEDEVAKGPERWDKVPLVVYHPTENGKPVSVQHPGVLEKSGIGFTRNSGYKGKLHTEGCFDIERVKAVDETLPEQHRILPRLKARKPIELSTGLFTDNKLEDGELVARNYRPDHIAILPDQEGACGIKHGCGVHNKAQEPTLKWLAKKLLGLVSKEPTVNCSCKPVSNAFSPAARQAALMARKRSQATAKSANSFAAKARVASKNAHLATDAGSERATSLHSAAREAHLHAAKVAPAHAKAHKAAADAHAVAIEAHKPTANCNGKGGKPGPCPSRNHGEALETIASGGKPNAGKGLLKAFQAGHIVQKVQDGVVHGYEVTPAGHEAIARYKAKQAPASASADVGAAVKKNAAAAKKQKSIFNQETVTMPSKLEELTANCKGMSDEQIQRIIDNVNKKPMTDAEWLASAPPGIQVAVNNAMAVVNDERKACIAKLVGNAENKEALTAVYEKMDLPALRTLAAQIVPPARNNFAGTAPAVPANNAASVVDEKDILPLPVMNWAQPA